MVWMSKRFFGWQLKVFYFQTSLFGDAAKHFWPNLIGVVKGPRKFTPDMVGQLDVR